MTWMASVSLKDIRLCPRLMRRLHKYGIVTLKDALDLVKSEEFELMFPRYYQQLQVLKALRRHMDDVAHDRQSYAKAAYLAALREPSRN